MGDRDAARDYLDALAAIEASPSPTSLEALFDQAEAAQGALMEISGGVDGKALLETFSDAEFAQLQAGFRGLTLHRGLDIYAQPDPAFFLALATAHGRPADVAYFTQEASTWGADGVPVYLMLRAQPTPCVRFGENRIVPLHQGWQAFAAAHPGAYAQRVARQLADLEETVVLGTCACGDAASVQREQSAFLAAFPAHPQAAAIQSRQRQLDSDPEAFPVHCR